MTTSLSKDRRLYLQFHGRIIEQLGIQMYQKPVNAIAEQIANAWDADATYVNVSLPKSVGSDGVFRITDDGIGMTFDECQDLYLKVGRNRRGEDPNELSAGRRPVLGRKGIGKFAGFGIAQVITIDTVSQESGERTVFQLDLDEVVGEEYISKEGKEVTVLEYEGPDESRKAQHGTTVELLRLTNQRTPNRKRFAESMARRYLLHQGQAEFEVLVEGEPIPDAYDAAGFEYVFPRDLPELPEGVAVDGDGWGVESVDGHEIRWRFLFHKQTIDAEELKGIAVFAKGKLAQTPFLFNITKGLTGQHGAEYLAGQVTADYIDLLPEDLIATERQRINWERPETRPLLDWGQTRLRQCLSSWAALRAKEKTRRLEERLVGFSERLERLRTPERRTVRRALTSLAKIPTLSDAQFEDLARAVLLAWEQGRLWELIENIADVDQLSEDELLQILVEARILTALNTLEVVRTRLDTISGLRRRIEAGELENAVRDFIAENPELVSPEWETFSRERGLKKIIEAAAAKAKLTADVYRGRVDLTMVSGQHLLVLEFVRPGLKVDLDHLQRFEIYVLTIRAYVDANTAAPFRYVSGYLVADELQDDPVMLQKLKNLERSDMHAMDWEMLLRKAEASWQQFIEILETRGADDFRMKEHFRARETRDEERVAETEVAEGAETVAGVD